jgi:hypothetical protein
MTQEPSDLRCRVGRHHYVEVPDDNPEKRGQTHQECARCGHIRDRNEYLPGNPGLTGM